jgi:hypothetical protein
VTTGRKKTGEDGTDNGGKKRMRNEENESDLG